MISKAADPARRCSVFVCVVVVEIAMLTTLKKSPFVTKNSGAVRAAIPSTIFVGNTNGLWL